jgi:murein L,D-transpeptidase YcbB/YkuD
MLRLKMLGTAARSLPLALVAASLMIGTVPAQAEREGNLFDMLFGGGVRYKPRNVYPDAPKPRKVVAAPRVTGPSYYDYKADPLVKVDFAALRALPEKATFDPAPAEPSISTAAAGLDGFDLLAEKDVARALADYYAVNPQFIWVTSGGVNAKAEQAIRLLGSADSYGLSPADYAVTVPTAANDAGDPAARTAELVRFEMTLSARVLRYVHDAQGGRVDPNRISGYHDFPAKPLDLSGVLATLAHTNEVQTYLESRHPQNAEYQALRVELEALKASEEDTIIVDPKLLLKPGETSPELPKLMQIVAEGLDDEFGGDYGETLATFGKSETYIPELEPVVKEVQKRAGLKPDGVVGPRTVASLAGTPKADRIDKVIIALEELRWLPSDLGSPRVFINEPAFTASFIEGGEEKLKMNVVVGKPSNQTAFFYRDAEQVDYNPYWGVPRSILVNEMLPRLRGDPGYLDRAGYEVTDSKGRHIPSASIDWGAYGSNIPFDVRQSPGEANALGNLKILFPNKHAIYMHDTPQKALFKQDMRAFSHGCVRLADPQGMAAAVLGTTVDYIAEKLKQGHASEKVTRKVPVYVSYFTAWPTLSGKVEYFHDVYSRDEHLKAAIAKTDAVRAPAS